MTFPIVQMVSCRGPPQNTGPQATACLACPIATPLFKLNRCLFKAQQSYDAVWLFFPKETEETNTFVTGYCIS